MKIGLQTWGSHGDIRPFIALAEGLQKSGHEVTLVITCVDSARYNNYTSTSGLKVLTVASPVIHDSSEWTKLFHIISAAGNALTQLKLLMILLFSPVESEMYEAAEQLCKNNDLVIGHYFQYPLQAAAEIYNVPYISISLAHNIVPTKYYPPGGFPDFGRFSNQVLWQILRAVLNATVKKIPDKFRIIKDLKPARDFLKNVWSSQHLNLVAVSKTICPRPADWPDHVQVVGFLDMPNITAEGSLSADLEDFLIAGEPPIFITFGSMIPSDIPLQKKLVELFIESVKIAKCRAIIQAPLWEECGFKNSPEIFFVKAAPHEQIFPHCIGVVHHGGAGTTQTSALSGVPSIVVFHISEQEFWGRQLERLEISSGVFSLKKLTSRRLAKCIKTLLNSPDIQEKAREVGLQMRKENGVENAVNLINSTKLLRVQI